MIQISPTARILVAGQAPGTRVHASGQPFTDPSGTRLREWMGIDETTFYDASRIAVVPMGHCFPGLDEKGGDLPPRRECAPRWRKPIIEAVPDLRLVLAIGRYACDWHIPERKGRPLTETVQDWREIGKAHPNPRIFPLPHPSWRNSGWLKRNPWFSDELLPVLQREIAALLSTRQAPAD